MNEDQKSGSKRAGSIPVTAVTFKLTEQDIQRYRDEILGFPLEDETRILKRLPQKLNSIASVRTFSTFIVDLIHDIELLYSALTEDIEIPTSARRMILFALNYFIEVEDEIPDRIDILGYVDDAVVMRWIVNEILKDNPGILALREKA